MKYVLSFRLQDTTFPIFSHWSCLIGIESENVTITVESESVTVYAGTSEQTGNLSHINTRTHIYIWHRPEGITGNKVFLGSPEVLP